LLEARAPSVACYLRDVQKRRLVVVDRDAWVHRALADSADGFELVECRSVRAGFNACCTLEPDCLLTALHPNDPDGIWLIEALRAQPGEISALPVVAMASRCRDPASPGGGDGGSDKEGTGGPAVSLRVQGLRAGADVVLQKPLEAVEVLAQVEALIAMTTRVRIRRRPLPGPDGVEIFAGDLDDTPVASVLATLELGRRSGELVLTIRGAVRRRLVLTLASGVLLRGQLDATSLTPLEAMRLALGWEGSRFEFVPGPEMAPPYGPTVEELLLEALHSYTPTTWRDLFDGVDLPEVSSKVAPPPPSPAPRPPPAATSTSLAPGHRLVESVVPGARSDPRAEVDTAQGTEPRR
jgi:DNA-binding response OmpR family regulator